MHIEMIDSRGNHLKTNSLLVLADWLRCLHHARDAHSERYPGDYKGYYRENGEVGHWFAHDMGFNINGSSRLNIGDLTFGLFYLMSPPPFCTDGQHDPLGRRLLPSYIEDEGSLIRHAYATLVAAIFATRWLRHKPFEWTEHSSLYDGIESEAHAADLLQDLQTRFPDAFFCVAAYEDRTWLLVGNNILQTRMYDIRRWLRDNQMLNRYSDDDDDDRAIWDIPADYQPESMRHPEP